MCLTASAAKVRTWVRKAVGKGSHYSLGCSLELFVVDLLKEAVKEGVTQLGTLYHMT